MGGGAVSDYASVALSLGAVAVFTGTRDATYWYDESGNDLDGMNALEIRVRVRRE